ncbi:MAG TPA: SNF2-related protein [Acidimicrobiales bacterium]|nr:SNF2-related protein [Acidimicrobiales bacterium]
MLTPADMESLRRSVGSATFTRGLAYAGQGAVRRVRWTEDGACAYGEVQGGAPTPYGVTVIVRRSTSDRIVGIDAVCTCPVEVNCKHAVALLLTDPAQPAAPPGTPAPRPRPTTAPRTAAKTTARAPRWETPLRTLIAGSTPGSARPGADEWDPAWSEPADIGLQFELVLTPSRTAPGASASGIRVRPVLRSHSGHWVRTGISWSNLEYLSYRRPVAGRTAEHLTVLTELLALSRVASRRSAYSASAETVWLQAINSRRLWDLLDEARDLQLPLIHGGRQAGPVDVRVGRASVTLDATRGGGRLELRPRVEIDDADVPLASSLLIGTPAHGIAWWDGPADPSASTARLAMAPFAAAVDEDLRLFLASTPLRVPPADEERFLRDFYPRLRRRIDVRSSDDSVDLPEPPPARILLTVTHPGGHRVELRWTRGPAGSGVRERLWEASKGAGSRLAENAIIDAVTSVVGSVPALLETGVFGERLAPDVVLDGMAAVLFVSELLPVLSAIEGVEVQQIGTVPAYHEVVEPPLVSLGGSSSDDRDWFDLSVTVTVDGEDVPFAELFVALAHERSHLVLPSGTYFSLDRPELRQLAELIAEARSLGGDPGDTIRLSRFQASLWEDLQRLGVVTAQARAWEDSVRALTEASTRVDHAVPDSLDATLRPYQLTGFNWLAYLYEHRLGGVLADDMGLGKTIQALALMCHTRERGLTASPFLVVAPTSVVGNWAAESRRFAPGLRAVTVTETEARRGVALEKVATDADIVVTSYALFRLEYDAYAAIDWAGLFLDEAQFAKNRASQAYRRAKMLPAPFKVAMTGTPIENNLMELWSLLSITAPGLFTSPDRFTVHFRTPIEKKADSERLVQLRRRVRPIVLRRTKEQVVADLPEKQEQVLELDLNARHKKLYQTYLHRERQKVLGLLGDMQKNRFEIFRSLTLLRQASLDMSLVDATHATVPSTKLDALMEMLEDVAADGHRVLVFSQFTRFLTLARQRIEHAGIDYCYLDGRTRKRDEVISAFRTGTAPVFLISLKAGGFGLNLTEADYCIILDPWWNPATEAQAVDRTHRIGQTKKVMVYRLVAKDTLEEKVMALKAKKSALFANVMDSGDFASGDITADDIEELLS